MSKEVIKLALEALEAITDDVDGTGLNTKPSFDASLDAITALREALAEQPAQQKPVVFYRCNGCGHAYEQVHPTSCDCMEDGGFIRVEYYTSPPAQQGQVAWTLLLTGENQGLVGKAGEKFVGHPEHYERVDVYTSSQRTWVGLTDEERMRFVFYICNLEPYCALPLDAAVCAIEAKLREKNT